MGFVMQCQLYLDDLPHQFPGDRTKTVLILSLLSGDAWLWAESLRASKSPNPIDSLDAFLAHFKEVFRTSLSALSVHEESS